MSEPPKLSILRTEAERAQAEINAHAVSLLEEALEQARTGGVVNLVLVLETQTHYLTRFTQALDSAQRIGMLEMAKNHILNGGENG